MTSNPQTGAQNATRVILRRAEERDLPVLAELNRQLLEDEGNLVEVAVEGLIARHREWMQSGEWSQDVLELDGTVIGYIVHMPNPYPLNPDRPELFLRQFCVDRSRRGGGLGREGFGLFLRDRVVPGGRVTLDVLESNRIGRAFWESVGCRPFFQRMEVYRDDGPSGGPGGTPRVP